MKIKKQALYLSIPILGFGALPTYGVCPLCIIVIGAGLGLSEYLGIDDTIAGVWIGGLLIGMVTWTIDLCNKKGWFSSTKKIRDFSILLLYYLLTLWPLWTKGFIGGPFHQLWGIDKLILGITVGTFAVLGASSWYETIKKNNKGHAQFPYQKVVMPVIALSILSLAFYFITRY